MPVVHSLVDEILELKQQRRAIILAHHYQESEIQELADVDRRQPGAGPQSARILTAT